MKTLKKDNERAVIKQTGTHSLVLFIIAIIITQSAARRVYLKKKTRPFSFLVVGAGLQSGHYHDKKSSTAQIWVKTHTHSCDLVAFRKIYIIIARCVETINFFFLFDLVALAAYFISGCIRW